MKKFLTIVLTAGAVLSLTACAGASSTSVSEISETPALKPEIIKTDATNVQEVKVHSMSNGFYIFDIERDGKSLTCTTKYDQGSGVSCFPNE